MKKLSKLAALATGMIVALFVGCSNISSDNGVASEGYTNAKSGLATKSLTLNVTSDSDLIDFSTSAVSASARTIAPEALAADSLDFYLGGSNLVSGTAITLQKVTFVGKDSSTTEGTVTIDLEASNYRFTLLAVKSGTSVTNTTDLTTLIGSAMLIGYATADLRYTEESASVNFVLASDGLSGNGQLKLDLYLDNWSSQSLALTKTIGTGTDTRDVMVVNDATIGLYDIKTGDLISTTKVSPVAFSTYTDSSNTYAYYGTTANTALSDIAVGTYDFTVTFTLKNGKSYIYSEPIILLPNQKTTATIGIPEVLNLPPAAPKNFKVGYIVPEYADSDYYKVVFNWDDLSNNELYFELDLYDVTASTTITPATANIAGSWTDSNYNSNTKTYSNSSANPSDSTHTSTVFYGLKKDSGPNWYAGSLNRNNEFAVFYMELGKRYLARIRAVNAAGDSEWATTTVAAASYTVAAAGATDATTGVQTAHSAYSTPAAATYKADHTAEAAKMNEAESKTAVPFNTEIIDLFRVKYELSGGKFTDATDLKTVYYFDQLDAGNPIMQPDGVRIIKLADDVVNSDELVYNGTKDDATGDITNAAVTLKYGDTESTAKPWTSWRIGSISGDTYESAYNAVATGTAFDPKETYYLKSGTTYGLVKLTEAPTDWKDYYTATLKPYKDASNIVLYANYTSSTFGVTIKNAADYLIENNLNIKANLTGTAGSTPKIYTSSTDTTGVANLDLIAWTAGADTYTSVTLSAAQADTSKTYYTRSGTNPDYTYTEVSDISAETTDPVYTKATGAASSSEKQYLIISRSQKTDVTYTSVATATAQADTTGKTYYKRTGASEPYTYTELSAAELASETDANVYTKNDSSQIKASNLVLTYAYNTEATNGKDAFGTYEKVILEVIQQGNGKKGTSVGTYTSSGTVFTVPLTNFTVGTYIATFKAYVPSSNVKTPYEFSVYIQLND